MSSRCEWKLVGRPYLGSSEAVKQSMVGGTVLIQALHEAGIQVCHGLSLLPLPWGPFAIAGVCCPHVRLQLVLCIRCIQLCPLSCLPHQQQVSAASLQASGRCTDTNNVQGLSIMSCDQLAG